MKKSKHNVGMAALVLTASLIPAQAAEAGYSDQPVLPSQPEMTVPAGWASRNGQPGRVAAAAWADGDNFLVPDTPESGPIPPNSYLSECFVLDQNGYLSYTAGPSFRGVDVSSHQKDIDWSRVARSGMDFAMIRAGYRGYTAGSINKDAYFDQNIQGALANGLQVGVYFYSQAVTPEEAREEAYQLLAWISGYPITYPVVFDWEKPAADDARTRFIDGETTTACARAFCEVVQEAGYIPMTYGSPNKVYNGGLLLDQLRDYPAFWLANYTRNSAPTTFRYHFDMWQYSSSGYVDGIPGNVDLNICLTDWSTLQ